MGRTLGMFGFLLALGLGVAGTLLVVQRRPAVGATEPGPREGGDLRDVRAALARIEAALERLAVRPRGGAPGPASAPVSARAPLPVDPAQLDSGDAGADVAALEALVRDLRTVLDQHVQDERAWRARQQTLGELKSERGEADWKALDALSADWHRDPEEAKRSVKLLGFRDVLARYGTPTEIWRNDGGAHWVYQRGVDELYFRFNDGFVTVLGVK